MKKYLLGLSAIVLAVGFSAFTKPVKKDKAFATVMLTFIGNPFNPSQVANETLWVEAAPHSCSLVPDKACAMEVDESFLTGTAPNRHLDVNFIDVDGTPGVSGAFVGYIPTQIGGSGTITDILNTD
jgi:hypothetical protein